VSRKEEQAQVTFSKKKKKIKKKKNATDDSRKNATVKYGKLNLGRIAKG